MSKAAVLRSHSRTTTKNGKERAIVEMNAAFTLRCDFCVARNRFGVEPTVEWDPMARGTETAFEFQKPVLEATEMDGWGVVPASDFRIPAGASNDRNWTAPAVKHVCSLCMSQHFPEDDR